MHFKSSIRLSLILLTVTATSMAMPLPSFGESAKPKIDAQSEKVLQKMSAYYLKSKNMTLKLTGEVVIKQGEQTNKQKLAFDATVLKPVSFDVQYKSAGGSGHFICDGKQIIQVNPAFKQYTKTEVDPDDDLMTHDAVQPILGGALFTKNPYNTLTKECQSGTYLGKKTIDKVEYHHLQLVRNDGDMDMWIQVGVKPLLRKVVLDQTRVLKSMGRLGSVKVTLNYTHWKIDQKLAKDRFVFKAPEGIRLVDRFQPPGPESLVGTQAAEFELPDLNGKTVKLSSLKGKIVVLDFWATWCGPCIKAMPIYAKVTKELASKGVVFYAVNLREDKEKIATFLEEQGLDINVIMDKEGATAKKYFVRGIPQSVIIGRDGKIAKVHVGLSPDLEETITKELKQLIKQKK